MYEISLSKLFIWLLIFDLKSSYENKELRTVRNRPNAIFNKSSIFNKGFNEF